MPAHEVCCPFCGEPFVVLLDEIDGMQSLITDCEICCRPMTVSAELANGDVLRCEVSGE